MNALDLAAALGNSGRMHPNSIFGFCPVHDDKKNPNLHITDAEDGKILIRCMTGCEQSDVISALKERGLWNGSGPKIMTSPSTNKYDGPPPWERPVEAEYDYINENGQIKYTNLKFSDGIKPRFMMKNADGKWGRKGIAPILFNIPSLQKAKRGICIVEGEKDVLNLERLGFTVTTSGGASSWKSEYNKWFEGKDVCVFKDNDSPGEKYAKIISVHLKRIAKTIRIIDLPDLKKHGDMSDWIEAGGTRDQLRAIIKSTSECNYEEGKKTQLGTEPSLPAVTDLELAKIGLIDWVDANSKGSPYPTKENLQRLLDVYGVTCRYDVMEKETSIRIPGEEYKVIDRMMTSQLADIKSIAGRHQLSWPTVETFLDRIAEKNIYNPVADWVTLKEWDGQDRLQDLVDTLGAKDPTSAKKLLWRWLISAVAAAFEPSGVSARGVLVLQGDQHIGKTYWLRALVGKHEDWFSEGVTLNPSDRDSVKLCLSKWIVELGELDSTFKKSDISALKSFIGKKFDTLFLRYSKNYSSFPRRTVFCGSVNPKIYLNDSTGSTRFWTIECTDSIDSYHKIDMQQVWAQAKVAYDKGEKWNLTQDELKILAGNNEKFEFVSPFYELILKKYDMDSEIKDEKQAAEVCIELGYHSPSNIQTRECSIALRKAFGEPEKIDGKIVWEIPALKKWEG